MKHVKKIFLHITHNCNAKCIHCAIPKFEGMISFDDYKNIVNMAKKSCVEYIIIGGGEPLLHPNILEMVKYASKIGLKIKIETNAKLLTRDILNYLKPHIFQLNISLDSFKSKTHNTIRGINIFKKTINMIKYARKIGIDVVIWTVVMKENLNEIKKLISFIRSLNINKISFLYATPVEKCFKNKKRILVNFSDYYNLIKNICYIDNDLKIRIAPYLIPFNKINEFSKEINSKIIKTDCLIYNKEIIHINSKGDIYPCVLLLSRKEFSLGNINNISLFKDVLAGNNHVWNKIISILIKQKKLVNKFNKTGCLGLCIYFKTNLDPRFNEGLPICPCKLCDISN